ncbi:hypothetical protein OHA19_43015 (plasmid) [Streptomyces sp. NBC_00012]
MTTTNRKIHAAQTAGTRPGGVTRGRTPDARQVIDGLSSHARAEARTKAE